jgi:hypothetical protein
MYMAANVDQRGGEMMKRSALTILLCIGLVACGPAQDVKVFDPSKTAEYHKQFPIEGVQRKPLELFAIDFRTATIDQLADAVVAGGGQSQERSKTYASFDAGKLVRGAKTLELYALPDNGAVTEAIYTLPSFMDVGQVKRMADLVSAKYGDMTAMEGEWGVGNVVAEWDRGDNVFVTVSRGWPSTTTSIKFINLPSKNYRDKLVEQRKAAEIEQKAKAVNQAL